MWSISLTANGSAAWRWQGFKAQKIVKPQKLNRMNTVENLQVSPAIAKPLLPAGRFISRNLKKEQNELGCLFITQKMGKLR